jgi:inosine-uridine nucleoside N-ribohydrolase
MMTKFRRWFDGLVAECLCFAGLLALPSCVYTQQAYAPGALGASPAKAARPVVKVIYDADLARDVDDVGALALLHAMADRGECEILGVVVSESDRGYDGLWGPPLADVINTYYGRPDIPLGVYRGPHQESGKTGTFAEKVATSGFAHDLQSGSDAENGTRLYRRLLAAAPDGGVVIVSSGFLTNLDGLLRSGPDDLSPLAGADLVATKVREWSCMAGMYPSSGEDGEYNLRRYPDEAARVLAAWPGKVTFAGAELGRRLKTGGVLKDRYDIKDNPVALAWKLGGAGEARESGAETAVLYGVRGLGEGGRAYFSQVRGGWNRFEKLGEKYPMSNLEKSQNVWVKEPDAVKNHGYLRAALRTGELEAVIDELVSAPPRLRPEIAARPPAPGDVASQR